MEILTKALEFMQVKVGYLIGIACALAILLFAPDGIIDGFGLMIYREQGKSYFGVVLLVCIAIIVAKFIGIAHSFIKSRYDKYLWLSARKKRLHILTAEEKTILRKYIEGETMSGYFDYTSGVIKGLILEDILYRSSSVSSPRHGFMSFAFNIQPWAWEYLNKHSYLLNHKN